MNKKHLHLYATLFLVSLLLSATVISTYAAPDSQQTTTIHIAYHQQQNAIPMKLIFLQVLIFLMEKSKKKYLSQSMTTII